MNGRQNFGKQALLSLLCAGTILMQMHHLRATTYPAVSLAQTVQQAPLIVRGTITDSYGNVTNMPYTYYTLNVTEVLKGTLNSSQQITIQEMGGLNIYSSGMVTFQKWEDVVLMLDGPTSDGYYVLSMGKMQISPTGVLAGAAIKSDHRAAAHQARLPAPPSSTPKTRTLDAIRKIIHFPGKPEVTDSPGK